MNVAPILHGECTGCHGPTTNASGGGYRFDFYDMTPDTCGVAAQAFGPSTIMAGGAAATIKTDVTPAPGSDRGRMPPLPGPALADWERETLLRWAADPVKGPPPSGNQPPTIAVSDLSFAVGDRLTLTAVVGDPDGDSVVGAIDVGGARLLMNRPGSFTFNLDTSTWPAGMHRLDAVLCDGWQAVSVDLGPIQVAH
jgi:hypothetical protein